MSDPKRRTEYDQSRIQRLPVQEQEPSSKFVRTERIGGGFIIGLFGLYSDGMKCIINPANKIRTRAFNPDALIMFRQGILIVKEGKKEFYIKSQTMLESEGFDRITIESKMINIYRVLGYNLNFRGRIKGKGKLLDLI